MVEAGSSWPRTELLLPAEKVHPMGSLTSKLIVALIDQVSGPARGVSAALDRMNSMQAVNAARLDAVRGRMIEAGAIAYALAKAISAPVAAAMELESAMADIAKVTDFDATGLKAFEKILRQMAIAEIPLATSELAQLAANAAQSGVPEEDLADFTRLTAKAAVAWEVTGGEAGESLAKIRTALNLSNADLFKYADAINHLSDRTAASAPDMVDFSRRVAAQGEFFGFSSKDTLAFGAAMISAGAASDVASTGFRNMGKALVAGKSASKSLRTAYAVLGLDSVKTAKRMQKDAVGTTLDVMERIGKLPKWQQASVMSQFFGDEARVLTPLLGQIDKLRETLGYVADETAYVGSVSREFENRSKTTENAVKLFNNRMNELGITIGSALLPAINDMMEIIGPMVTRLAEWVEAHPALTRAIIVTTAALVGLRVAALAAQFSFLWMKGGVLSAGILGLRGIGAAIRFAAAPFLARSAIASARALLTQRQAAYQAARAMQALAYRGNLVGLSLSQATANVASAGRALVQAQTGMRAANAGLVSIGFAGRALAFLPALHASIGSVIAGIAATAAAITAPVWAVIGVVAVAVAGLGLAIYNYWVPVSQFVLGFAYVVGGAVAEIVSVMASLGGRLAAAVGSWAKQKLIDFAVSLGFDEAAVRAEFDLVLRVLSAQAEAVISFFRSIPTRIGDWISDIFTINSFSDADAQGFREAGEHLGRTLVDAIGSGLTGVMTWTVGLIASVREMGPGMLTAGGDLAQHMWAGIRAKLDAMVAWFSGLPARIVVAIGSIDLSSLIEWPSPPAWLTRLWGGEEGASINVAAAASTDGQADTDSAATGAQSEQPLDAHPTVETTRLERAVALANTLREKLFGLPPVTLKSGTGAAAATENVPMPEPTTEGWGSAATRGIADSFAR